MYKVYVDGQLICDSRIDELALINPVVTLEVNSTGSFVFTIPSEHPRQLNIVRRKSVISVIRENETEPIFQGICTEISVDFFKQKTVHCEGELTYLNDSVQRPRKYQGITVLELLTEYIANHNAQVDEFKQFEVGNVTVTDANNYVYCFTNMNSTMEEIKADLVDDYGGYLRVRYENGKKYIDYLAESPRTSTQTIELGKNLTDYKSNIDSVDLATVVIPLGATLEEQTIEGLDTRLTISSVNDGKDYLQGEDATANYGLISKTVVFDSVSDPNVLKQKGEKYLSEIQFENVVIEASAVDFGNLTNSINKFRLLDYIHVISAPHGMDKWFVLTKQTLNLNNPENDRITLGKNEVKSLTAQVSKANSAIYKAVEQNNTPSFIQQAIEQATAMITGAEGGYIKINYNSDGLPYELLVMDTDDIATATKVWRWNQNGLGYSSTGYGGKYGLAMTSDGKIVADYITTGTLDGNNVNVVNVVASSVAAENITGEQITGKKFVSNKNTGTEGGQDYEDKTEINGASLSVNRGYPAVGINKTTSMNAGELNVILGSADKTTINGAEFKSTNSTSYTDIKGDEITVYEGFSSQTTIDGKKITSKTSTAYTEIDASKISQKDSLATTELSPSGLKFNSAASIEFNNSSSTGNILKFAGTGHIRQGTNTTDSIAVDSTAVTIPTNANIGGANSKLGFFGTTTNSTRKTVAKITSPTTASAATCASKINDLIDALKAYNLIG